MRKRGENDAADLSAPRRTRVGVFLVVALLHGLAVLALIQAFAPRLANQAVQAVVATFTVTVTAPPPPNRQAPDAQTAGAAGSPGRRAAARAETAPPPDIAIAPRTAPRAASTGAADTAGATAAGNGTGAGGDGSAAGRGAAGSGTGQGLARKAEKIAGAIVEQDYDKAHRALRLGHAVTLVITVSAAGVPSACRVVRPSPDPAADALTCRLAVERFRFRPANDAQGNPVASLYGWQQRWF